jgi:hypothetical protein
MTSSRATPCDQCGFLPPARRELPSAIGALPSRWVAALRSDPSGTFEDAARVRDELHAVANRVGRLLVAPGSTLSPVHIDVPTELARPPSIDLLTELLRIEADRLADLAESIGAEWGWIGRVGAGPVSVAALAAVPLHTTHQMLTRDGCGGASVVLLATRRSAGAISL